MQREGRLIRTMVVMIDHLWVVMNFYMVHKIGRVMNDCVVFEVRLVLTENFRIKILRQRNVTVMMNIRLVMNETVGINSTRELMNKSIMHEIIVRRALKGNKLMRLNITERLSLMDYNRVVFTYSMDRLLRRLVFLL